MQVPVTIDVLANMDERYPNLFRDLSTAHYSNWEWYTGAVFASEWLNSILDLSQPANQQTSRAIIRNFQSCNKIAEIVKRHASAIAPNRIQGLTPLLRSLQKKWQRENAGKFGNPLEEAVLLAKLDEKSYIRLFFQKTYTAETKEEALEIHCPPMNSVQCFRNSDNILQWIDYTYTEKNEKLIERQFLSKGLTVFQTINKDGEVVKEFSLDLGGGFTVFELNLPTLITDSIKQNQNAINSTLTLLIQNILKGGWIQESVLNAQKPGSWDFDEAGREKFTPNPEGLLSGPGVTRFIQGLPLRDERDNLIGYTQPDIRLQQPIDPDTFLKTYNGYSHIIYDQCSQSWVSNVGLVLSAKSRKEAIKDFNLAIIKDSEKTGFLLSDLFSVSNYLLGIKQKIDINIIPNLEVDDETRKIIIELHRDGLMSRRTAITLLGFASDVDAEIAELDAEAKIATEKPAVVDGGFLDLV